MSMKILYSEDRKFAENLSEGIKGLEVSSSASNFLKAAAEAELVLLDLDSRKEDGLKLFQKIRSQNQQVPAIAFSSSGDIELAVKASKLGIGAFLHKPFDLGALKAEIEKLTAQRGPRRLIGLDQVWWLKGCSPVLTGFLESLTRAAQTNDDLVLIAEPGIETRQVAGLLHRSGIATQKRFVSLDLTAFEKESLESSFFLTLQELLSAQALDTVVDLSQRTGTIFFSGAEGIPGHFLKNILMFLKKRKTEDRFDKEIRVIFSVGCELPELKGVEQVRLPPLRDRKEDLPALIMGIGMEVKELTLKAMNLLSDYDFPGNYNELKNLVSLTMNNRMDLASLPLSYRAFLRSKLNGLKSADLVGARRDFEKDLFEFVLAKSSGSLDKAAAALNYPKTAFSERMIELGIEPNY